MNNYWPAIYILIGLLQLFTIWIARGRESMLHWEAATVVIFWPYFWILVLSTPGNAIALAWNRKWLFVKLIMVQLAIIIILFKMIDLNTS